MLDMVMTQEDNPLTQQDIEIIQKIDIIVDKIIYSFSNFVSSIILHCDYTNSDNDENYKKTN